MQHATCVPVPASQSATTSQLGNQQPARETVGGGERKVHYIIVYVVRRRRQQHSGSVNGVQASITYYCFRLHPSRKHQPHTHGGCVRMWTMSLEHKVRRRRYVNADRQAAVRSLCTRRKKENILNIDS